MTVKILIGDCREMLRTLPDQSVHCCVTSPPYFGLRDYGVAGQIGLEPTPDAFVAEMVAVFREVRRVLRDDGTLWLNLGDSYAGHGSRAGLNLGFNERVGNAPGSRKQETAKANTKQVVPDGLKPKDLIGIPWRVAFALQSDGWWLRSSIIWHKPNPMPESVRDRPTSAHENIFLLAKGQSTRRAIKLSDLASKPVHLGLNVGTQTPDVWAHEIGVCLASAILDCPKVKEKLGSALLNSQVWQQHPRSLGSSDIANLPPIERIAAYAARLLHGHGPAKDFLCEMHSLGLDLRKGDHLLIRGADIEVSLPPSVHSYGETSIAVYDAGKIGQFDFAHGQIIAHTPSTCTYYFDAEAVKEAADVTRAGQIERSFSTSDSSSSLRRDVGRSVLRTEHRNIRNVWTVPSQPFSDAHFATFPPALIEPCVKAGCPAGGTVLDPFGGAGTTGLVADRLQRNAILIELNPAYAAMAERRIASEAGMFASVEAVA